MKEIKSLIISLNNQNFGILIHQLKSILALKEISPLKKKVKFVVGFMNINNKKVPLIDIKERLELVNTEINSESKVILTTIQDIDIAFLCDNANEIIDIENENFHTKILNLESEKQITGIYKMKDNSLLPIINLHSLINQSELTTIKKISKNENKKVKGNI